MAGWGTPQGSPRGQGPRNGESSEPPFGFSPLRARSRAGSRPGEAGRRAAGQPSAFSLIASRMNSWASGGITS